MKPARVVGQAIVLLILLGLLWFVMHFRLVDVVQRSMEPTLHPGDKLLVRVRSRSDRTPPPRGAVVVLQPPGEAEWVVKRVVGVGGDELLIGPRGLRLNGRPVAEDYITRQSGDAPAGGRIPEGSVYVLGDNRPESNDSRDYGTVELDRLMGQVIRIVAPAGRRQPLPPAAALDERS